MKINEDDWIEEKAINDEMDRRNILKRTITQKEIEFITIGSFLIPSP